jgi:chaperonin GroES
MVFSFAIIPFHHVRFKNQSKDYCVFVIGNENKSLLFLKKVCFNRSHKGISTHLKRVLTARREGRYLIMKLRPLGDRVVLQYQKAEETTKTGIILPDSAKEKPQEAIVIAVGAGNGDEKMQVKEGDKVFFSKYSGTEVKLEEEEYIIVSQKEIIAVVE